MNTYSFVSRQFGAPKAKLSWLNMIWIRNFFFCSDYFRNHIFLQFVFMSKTQVLFGESPILFSCRSKPFNPEWIMTMNRNYLWSQWFCVASMNRGFVGNTQLFVTDSNQLTAIDHRTLTSKDGIVDRYLAHLLILFRFKCHASKSIKSEHEIFISIDSHNLLFFDKENGFLIKYSVDVL